MPRTIEIEHIAAVTSRRTPLDVVRLLCFFLDVDKERCNFVFWTSVKHIRTGRAEDTGHARVADGDNILQTELVQGMFFLHEDRCASRLNMAAWCFFRRDFDWHLDTVKERCIIEKRGMLGPGGVRGMRILSRVISHSPKRYETPETDHKRDRSKTCGLVDGFPWAERQNYKGGSMGQARIHGKHLQD